MGADWSFGAIARDFGTAVASFVPGKLGEGARNEVKRRTENIGGLGGAALDILGPPTTNAQAIGGLALAAIPGGRAAAGASRIAAKAARGGERIGFNFLGRSAARAATKAAPRTLPKWGKRALIGTGVAAYGYDVASSIGREGNPLIPDPLENLWNAGGDIAKAGGDAAKWAVPVALGIGGLLVAKMFLGKGR